MYVRSYLEFYYFVIFVAYSYQYTQTCLASKAVHVSTSFLIVTIVWIHYPVFVSRPDRGCLLLILFSELILRLFIYNI